MAGRRRSTERELAARFGLQPARNASSRGAGHVPQLVLGATFGVQIQRTDSDR